MAPGYKLLEERINGLSHPIPCRIASLTQQPMVVDLRATVRDTYSATCM